MLSESLAARHSDISASSHCAWIGTSSHAEPLGAETGQLHFVTRRNFTMNNFIEYAALIKPVWSPPAWVFGPVWTVLYGVIALSFGRVFFMVWQGRIPFVVAVPFVLNLVFNFSFTWLQFGLKNNFLASLDILLVLGTLVWAMVAIFPNSRLLAYAQIPYLLWVSFATVLQLTITWLNR